MNPRRHTLRRIGRLGQTGVAEDLRVVLVRSGLVEGQIPSGGPAQARNYIPTGDPAQTDAVQLDAQVETRPRRAEPLTQVSRPAPVEPRLGSLQRRPGVGPPRLLLQNRDLSQVCFHGLSPFGPLPLQPPPAAD